MFTVLAQELWTERGRGKPVSMLNMFLVKQNTEITMSKLAFLHIRMILHIAPLTFAVHLNRNLATHVKNISFMIMS